MIVYYNHLLDILVMYYYDENMKLLRDEMERHPPCFGEETLSQVRQGHIRNMGSWIDILYDSGDE